MSYPIVSPTYKSYTEAHIHVKGLDDFFKNRPHYVIPCIPPEDLLYDYLGITFKPNYREAITHAPRDSLPENKQLNHHGVVHLQELDSLHLKNLTS
ncbi:unnamed protein product [Linum trigynum]|uniref:Uncharacterized protein n=1 Tax=Linum trigynum TaxID=586398 RepID=A0AAV2ECL7_9ROSI